MRTVALGGLVLLPLLPHEPACACIHHGADSCCVVCGVLCIPPSPFLQRVSATLAVDATMRIRKHLNLEHIHIIKKPGGSMRDSYLDEVSQAVVCG